MAIAVWKKDKHLQLDPRKIDRARRILGAHTETETIERSLDLVIAERRIEEVLRRGRGRGKIEQVF